MVIPWSYRSLYTFPLLPGNYQTINHNFITENNQLPESYQYLTDFISKSCSNRLAGNNTYFNLQHNEEYFNDVTIYKTIL